MEGEDVFWLDAERDILSRARRLAPLGPSYHQVLVLGQPHMQEGVGAKFFYQHHLAGQLDRKSVV